MSIYARVQARLSQAAQIAAPVWVIWTGRGFYQYAGPVHCPMQAATFSNYQIAVTLAKELTQAEKHSCLIMTQSKAFKFLASNTKGE
ncbi:hypothetical protein NFHSH190041_37050 (plasmid) [Shewanella sp. NFH-SH190041]|uniref:hypothetical protein n=1 Tax=Shewanella sp. NFH-SH190041 TaxID=2950245 RepID=UPI0021C4B5C6|nr:hypothetical protein [Shewanella sp. NFH-SH190041]BDM66253.1 hypothetical protein NFHSH190041_37050 [Shewanella sp. NFH-SH190041]